MRSDDRDFVDDMLDDVSFGIPGLLNQAAINAGLPSLAKPAAPGASTPAAGAPSVVVQMPTGDAGSGAIKSTGMSDAAIAAAFPAALAQAAAAGAGVKLVTPGSAPHLETPGVAVTAIPGEEGRTLGAAIASVTDPRLRQIVGSLRAMRVQTQATSEHNALAAQDQFRKDVTARLARIESRLPSGSLRSQVSTVRSRILPLLLG